MSELTAVRTVTSRAAWVAGLGLLGFFVAEAVISAFTRMVGAAASMGYGPDAGWMWLYSGLSVLMTGLPVAVMAAVSFAVIAPVRADQRLTQVLARGVVAAALGTLLVFTVQVVASLVISPPTTSAISGLLDAEGFAPALQLALSHITTFVTHVPVVVLAAVLLWLGLRRDVTAASD